MKQSIIFLSILFLVSTALANWHPMGKTGAKTTYKHKAVCEKEEGQKCVDITDRNLMYEYYDYKTQRWVEHDKNKAAYEQKKLAKIATKQRKKTEKANHLTELKKCKRASVLPGAKVKVCVEHLVKMILNE